MSFFTYIHNHRRLFFCLGLVLLFFVWRHFSEDTVRRGGMAVSAPPVRVATAIAQNVPHFLNGLGTVIPSVDVLVKSRVDGQLLRLHFKEGQRVQAGDLLAEIDPRPFEAALSQAEGNLAKNQAQLDNARSDLQRYAKLSKGDFIAAQQYETQRALVRQYQGTVEADKAAVASARLQVEYSRITAPVGGRLGLRNVDEGNQIKASDTVGLVRITEVSPCDVLFTLPESQVDLVVSAFIARERDTDLAPLPVQAWDREQKERLAVGYLLSLDNQIDAATGTVRLKARFANESNKLFPNQFVNARLMVQMLENAVTIPAGAVQLGARGSYVYVVSPSEEDKDDEAVVSLRQVSPGITTARMAVIDEGLKAGEVVVVDGLDRLRDGIAVRVAASTETPKAETVE